MVTIVKYKDIPGKIKNRSGLRSLVAIARVWLVIAASLMCVVLVNNGLVWGVSAVVNGVMIYHLNILAHDGLHYSLFNNKKINNFVTRWLLLAPQAAPLTSMRNNHLYHHKRLGYDDDLDKQYYGLEKRHSATGFILWFVAAFSGFYSVPLFLKLLKRGGDKLVAKSNKISKILDVFSIVVVQIIIASVCWLATDVVYAYILLWLMPMFTIMVGLNSTRSCLEHAVTSKIDDGQEGRMFSFKSNFIESFFLSPFNMNYHAEHHAFMSIPYHQLPELSRFLHNKNVPVIVCPSYTYRFKEILNNLKKTKLLE